jgi:hypothetical protein
MKIEKRKIADLSQDPANVRKHPERNLDAIIASLRRFGQQHPIVIDINNTVRAGNGRLQAAIALGWDEIDCVVTDLKGSEAIAYAIADNRTAELAEWDDDMLAAQLHGLLTDDEALLKAAGFDEDELAAMLDELEGDGTTGEIVEDEVPEPPADPITKPGDLWLLGEHRVLCGDSTKAEHVERLMAGAKAKCLITDPPYGIDWQGSNASTLEWQGIANDTGKLNLKPILSDYEIVVAFGANCYPHDLPHRGRWICWDKRVNENADRMLGSPFELAWSNKTSGFDKIYRIMHGGVVNDDGHNARRVHPTQKPIRLMVSIIDDYSDGNDVIDLFLGSGTTLIAAEQLGRKCYGMEISPAYCDVIVKRWENLTGQKAVCQSATPA